MQVNSFTNIELSSCLDVLYGLNNGRFSSRVFTCVDSKHSHLRNAIEIKGPEEHMNKIISKVEALGFKAWTKNESITEIDCFYSSSNGRSRLTITNERSVNIFKETLYKDLQLDETALNSYIIRIEYKKASL